MKDEKKNRADIDLPGLTVELLLKIPEKVSYLVM